MEIEMVVMKGSQMVALKVDRKAHSWVGQRALRMAYLKVERSVVRKVEMSG